MFTELMPLLRKRRLLLTICLIEGDTIRATIVPQKASDTEDNALTTPLAITGTAEELDRDLPQQLVEFTGAHLQHQTTLVLAVSGKRCRLRVQNRPIRPASASGEIPGATRTGALNGGSSILSPGGVQIPLG